MTTSESPSMVFAKAMLCGGLSNGTSSSILNMFDVTKIRLQIQHTLPRNEIIYTSTSHTIKRIWTEEGLQGLLFPGLVASILRELSYSGLRFALYSPIKTVTCELFHSNPQQPYFIVKFISGFSAGTIASFLANPCDLVKIRLQAEAGRIHKGVYTTGLFKGQSPSYKNTFHAFYKIAQQEGIQRGLYRGASATAFRAALVTGGQLSSYDHTKYVLKSKGYLQEGILLHILGSVVAGLTASVVAAPADIIKTRMLGQTVNKYSSLFDCFQQTVRKEGPFALFKGWVPSYLRIAPHFIIALPLYEQFRKWMGLPAM